MLTLFLMMVIGYGFGTLVALAGGRGVIGRGLVATQQSLDHTHNITLTVATPSSTN